MPFPNSMSLILSHAMLFFRCNLVPGLQKYDFARVPTVVPFLWFGCMAAVLVVTINKYFAS